jgi:TRAP-type C4-dicarboxylate transport system permease small subunit
MLSLMLRRAGLTGRPVRDGMGRLMRYFVRAEAALGKLLLCIIVILVFAAGILRWFDRPLIWSVDLAQLLFIWVSFIGANQALRKRVHIGMDLLVRPFPIRLRQVIEIALALLTLAFLLYMVLLGYRLTTLNLERVYGDSGISYAFVTSAVPIGCLLLAITLAGHLFGLVRTWRTTPRLVFSDIGRGEVEDVL